MKMSMKVDHSQPPPFYEILKTFQVRLVGQIVKNAHDQTQTDITTLLLTPYRHIKLFSKIGNAGRILDIHNVVIKILAWKKVSSENDVICVMHQ